MAGIRGGPAAQVLPAHRQGTRTARRARRLLARDQSHRPATVTAGPMNKVTIVNLNGRAFQVEEQAYEALRAYLEIAADRLADDPDCLEIMSDIEQAIGDKGARLLGAGRNVLSGTDMNKILEEMGPVETGAEATAGASMESASAPTAGPRETSGPKRLYRIEEGEMVAGICNGLAAYFGVDPTIVRLVFVMLLVLSSGFFAIAYLVMMFIV